MSVTTHCSLTVETSLARLKLSTPFRISGHTFIDVPVAHNIALVLSDGRWIPRKLMLSLASRPTADFGYIRWMGPNRDLVDYTRVQVDRSHEVDLWSDAIEDMSKKVSQIYGYVANTFSGHSPATARELQERLGLSPVDPDLLGEQMSLF